MTNAYMQWDFGDGKGVRQGVETTRVVRSTGIPGADNTGGEEAGR
ncbi:hypothetical protein [Plantactinospora sp. B5E13]